MRTQNRGGFTLIELMVAMALTMFIMVILSQAFVISLETFAAMKGIGDMQGNLRSAKVILHDDLSQDHLEGNRRLSDMGANGLPLLVTQRPQAGFLAVRHGSVSIDATAANPYPGPFVREGRDAANLSSFRATNHVLYMTVKRKGNRPDNFFTAALPNTNAATNTALTTFFSNQSSYAMPSGDLASATYTDAFTSGAPNAFFSSQWSEVIYYLVQTGSTEEPNNPASIIGTPTFSLFRAQYVMVTDSTNVSNKPQIPNGAESVVFHGISCNPGATALDFYSPSDAATFVASATPNIKRMFPDLLAFNPNTNLRLLKNGSRETLVLPNVTSFHVRVMRHNSSTFTDLTTNGGVFDTTRINSGGTYTDNYGLKGIQITLRVFEPKTRQTRQMTIVQDL